MQAAPFGLQAFRECGWPAFLVLILAGVGVLLALVTLGLAVARQRWALALGGLASCVAIAAMAAGALGSALGERQVERALALAGLDAEQSAHIRAQGYAEAEQCTKLGLASGAVPLALSLTGLLLAALRRHRA